MKTFPGSRYFSRDLIQECLPSGIPVWISSGIPSILILPGFLRRFFWDSFGNFIWVLSVLYPAFSFFSFPFRISPKIHSEIFPEILSGNLSEVTCPGLLLGFIPKFLLRFLHEIFSEITPKVFHD